MNKILVYSLMAMLLGANFVFAEEGMYEDKFKSSGMYKVRTNPIAEWLDGQVNKSYVEKKKTDVKKDTSKNKSFKSNNTVQKTAPKPTRVYSTGGWSS